MTAPELNQSRSDQLSPRISEGGPPILAGNPWNRFCDLAEFTLNGSAAEIDNPVVDEDLWKGKGRKGCILRLTDDFNQTSSAFLSEKVRLGKDGSFRTSFRFRITESAGQDPGGDAPGADGLVFVVQNAQSSSFGGAGASALGVVGGGIGYWSVGRSLGIEFDTFFNDAATPEPNSRRWDPNGNHVGINVDGVMASLANATVVRPLNSGQVWRAHISYDGNTDRLRVQLGDKSDGSLVTVSDRDIDLPALLGGGSEAFVGFTSATGAAKGTHEILSWQFQGAGDSAPTVGE